MFKWGGIRWMRVEGKSYSQQMNQPGPAQNKPSKERRTQETEALFREKQHLIADIREAKAEWENAQRRLDYVTDPDQIDYVIYSLEAAEKRYGMLLKHAKQLKVHALRDSTGMATEG
jgi:hypothetical protein